MKESRRSWLKKLGTLSTVGGGSTLGAKRAAAATKPSVDWRPADSSNYTNANRSAADIDWVIVHVAEGSASGTVSWFQNASADVSAHYVVGSDGYRAQSVSDADIAWHAGNWTYNEGAIGIEHGGYTDQTNFSDALYQSSAKITRYVCDAYDIPKEHPSGVAPCDGSGGGIIGHSQVPDPGNCGLGGGAGHHSDPGSTWDWETYMSYVGGTNAGGGSGGSSYSWPYYSNGDQGEGVYSVQYLLESHGYALQYHDGVYGTETENAVQQFQSDNGLSADGIAGPNTWENLYVLVSGSHGPYWATYGCQHNLRDGHGYSISVDGDYGPETRNAIESFQQSAGLTADGIVGHDTWRAMVDTL